MSNARGILALDLADEWRPIPSYPDYEINRSGTVRRLTAGHSNCIKVGKAMAQRRGKGGYMRVGLFSAGRVVWRAVHRLVLETWVGPTPSNRHQTAHWNGVRDDNRVENLRWATAKENAADRRRHGTVAFGERVGPHKFNSDDIIAIRACYPAISQEKLARRWGTSQSHIGRIVRRELWGHVP